MYVPRSFSYTGKYSPGRFSSITEYFHLHGCVHAPLFASLPVKKFESKHLPEYEIHIAPWINVSISMSSGILSLISRISRSESSRAVTTRFAPI